VELSFRPPAVVWSTNADRTMHWAKRSKIVKAWRETACFECRAAGIKDLDPSLLRFELPFARGGRRDPMNYVGTVIKAMVDGLVEAGCWPDDTGEFVEVRQPMLVVGGDGLVVISFSPL